MTEWSSARPKIGERCRFTARYVESLRAHFAEIAEMHGIVRLRPDDGSARIRLDGIPGELYETRLTNLVREDHEGPDPLDETVLHVTEMRVWTGDETDEGE